MVVCYIGYMATQVVKSYVRSTKQEEVQTQPSITPMAVLGGASIILTGIVLWKITLLISLIGASIYAYIKIRNRKSVPTVIEAQEALQEATVKTTRTYNKRVKVNHFQDGKISI